MSKKPRHKQRAFSNLDWLLYCLLDKHYEKEKRIQFHIPANADALYRVYDHRYLLTHGDCLGVRGGDGIIGQIGPIMRGDAKLRASAGGYNQEYDTLLLGHYHQYLPMRRLIVNSSLKGADEYARDNRFAAEPPSQAMWWSHPKYGPTYQLPIFTEEIQPAKEGHWACVLTETSEPGN